MMLLWDGLQVEIPKGMEPAALDRGFIRLIGSKMPTVSLRFGPEKRKFDPRRDGRRILRAARRGGSHVQEHVQLVRRQREAEARRGAHQALSRAKHADRHRQRQVFDDRVDGR